MKALFRGIPSLLALVLLMLVAACTTETRTPTSPAASAAVLAAVLPGAPRPSEAELFAAIQDPGNHFKSLTRTPAGKFRVAKTDGVTCDAFPDARDAVWRCLFATTL